MIQGGADAGEHIRGVVQGDLRGSGDFATFYASAASWPSSPAGVVGVHLPFA
jgi:hypothetical protein